MCKQGKRCIRNILIDSKVMSGWSNGQRQVQQLGRIDDFVDQHLQWEKFTFTVVQNLLEEMIH